MFNIFRKDNMVQVYVSKSDAGLLITNGAKDYLLHAGAETDSFIANYVPAEKQNHLLDGRVVQIEITRVNAASMDLL